MLPIALSKPMTAYNRATTSPPMNWLLDPAPALTFSDHLLQLTTIVTPNETELALLAEIGQAMRDASICGLGQTASSAIESALRHPELVAL